MLTRAMAKELSAALAHECLFVDFLFEEEPKKVPESLTHPGLVDVMQEELNQVARNKVWTLVLAPYGKTIIGFKWTLTMLDATWKGKPLQVPIFCDNTSAIAISNNPVLHSRTKHIDIKYYFIKDHILKGDIELHFIPTQYQLADIFTKPLDELTFKRLKVELEAFTRTPNQYKKYMSKFGYTTKALNNSKVWFSTPTGGILDEVRVNTFRNAIRENYLSHSTEYVKVPSLKTVRVWFSTSGYSREIKAKGTLRKCFLPLRWRLLMSQIIQCPGEAFTRTPNQYKKYMSKFGYTTKALNNSKVWFSTPTGGILGEVGVNTFRNAIRENYLSHSTEYVKVPSIKTVREWFSASGYSREIKAKGTLRKCFLPLRWRLLMSQIIQCPGGNTYGFDCAWLIWEDIINKLNKKTRDKVFLYPRFLSLLLKHKMEGYGNDNVTLNPTQIFSVHNWMSLWLSKLPKPPLKMRRRGTSKEGANPQLSSVVSASITKHVYSAFTILHSESASGHDASATSTTEADPGKTNLNDSILYNKVLLKEPKTISCAHIFVDTSPSVLVEKTKSAEDGLKTAHTETGTNLETSKAKKEVSFRDDEFNTSPDRSSSDDGLKVIKLEDLSNLVQNIKVDFMKLDT
nr:retrovirus-related Pol polyprotein from transposon TNT 1-94 [Tanacetum cinerariifolium]